VERDQREQRVGGLLLEVGKHGGRACSLMRPTGQCQTGQVAIWIRAYPYVGGNRVLSIRA